LNNKETALFLMQHGARMELALKELSLKDYCRLLEISNLPRQGIGGCPAKGGGGGGKCGSQ
jgi:hypothetical protein